MVSLLRMHLDASQPKAELAQLQILNQRVATSIGATWGIVNKTLMASAGSLALLGGGFYAAYAANSEFNKSMTHTRALSDLTVDQIESLTKQVSDLAIVYGESSTVIAEGLVVLAKAGLKYEDIMSAMPTIVQLMKANAVDFDTAANIAIMTMNAFNKPYSELAEVGDKVQKVVQATLLDIDDMQQSLQFAASTAQLAGVPFESLLAVMGTLANNAMRAGLGARSVNQMMLNIVENVDQVQQWADSMNLGVQIIKDGKINIDEIIPAFGKLGMSIDTLTESNSIFTNNALRAWGVLIANADDYTTLLGEINNSQGELGRTTNIQITSLQTMMSSMKEMILAPFRTPEVTNELAKAMNQLRESMSLIGPALANLVLNLLVNFRQILPDLIMLLNQFVKTAGNLVPLISFFARILAGVNPKVLEFYLLFRLIARSKFYEGMMNLVFGFRLMALESESLALKLSMLDLQMIDLYTSENVLNYTDMTWMGQTKMRQLQLQSETLQAQSLANARRQLVSLGVGLVFTTYMGITAANKEAKALAALVTGIQAATIAYIALGTAKVFATPVLAPMQAAAVASAIGLGAGLAIMATPTRKPEEVTLPSMTEFTYPEFTGTTGFQRGTRYVPKDMVTVVHKGEEIKSANKEHDEGSGLVINFNNSIVGEGAYEEIRRKLSRLDRRDLGRLPA